MQTKTFEMVDAFWKNWSQSVSMLSTAGKQMEHLTLETMKQQQEAIHKMTETMTAMEQEAKQYMSRMSTQYTDYMKQMGGAPFAAQLEEWQNRWMDMMSQMQQMTMYPTKASMSMLSQTSDRMEESVKQLIEQNQQQREDMQKQMNSFLEELRVMQMDLIKKFEEGSQNLMTSVK